MLNRIYLKTKTEYDEMTGKLKAGLEAHTGLSFPALQIRDVIIIDGEADTVSVELCKSSVFSGYCESLENEEAPADRTVTVMKRPGRSDALSEEIKNILSLNPHNTSVNVSIGREYVFSEPLTQRQYDGASEYFCDPLTETVGRTGDSEMDDHPENEIAEGFNSASYKELAEFKEAHRLEMDIDDMMCIQNYFLSESREPTFAEIAVIDRFFGEDFRHTTFETVLDKVQINDPDVKTAWEHYRAKSKTKAPSLSDISEMAKGYGSDENTFVAGDGIKGVRVTDDDGRDLLVMFRNESRNRSVTVEPFGGASGCLSEVVREMSSKLGYVSDTYRVSGVTESVESLANSKRATEGFSEYATKIGVPCTRGTRIVNASYSEKQLELCVAVSVAGLSGLAEMCKRSAEPGDIVYLVGGRTGRDGALCFRRQTAPGTNDCAKGEYVPVTQSGVLNSLVRLLLREDAQQLINSASAVGSGGIVCAVVGLSAGAVIHSEKIPSKYPGLSVTELILSESQERMIICVSPQNSKKFRDICHAENVSFAEIAEITDGDRIIVTSDKSRREVSIVSDFLLSGGTEKHRGATVDAPSPVPPSEPLAIAKAPLESVSGLKKLFSKDVKPDIRSALVSACRFIRQEASFPDISSDESAGGLMFSDPFSHKTPDASVRYLGYMGNLVKRNGSRLCTVIGFGVQPEISCLDPFKGAYLSVTDAVMKAVASGFCGTHLYLSLHEYLPEQKNSGKQFGIALASVLGALEAQTALGVSSLGGRLSTGSSGVDRENYSTVAAFILGIDSPERTVTRNFKYPSNRVVVLRPACDRSGVIPDPESQRSVISAYSSLLSTGQILSAVSVTSRCVASGILEMCRASGLGFDFDADRTLETIFDNCYGAIIAELAPTAEIPRCAEYLGKTQQSYSISYQRDTVSIEDIFVLSDNKQCASENSQSDEGRESCASADSSRILPSCREFIWLDVPSDSYGSVRTVNGKRVSAVIAVNNYSAAVWDVVSQFSAAGCDAKTVAYGESNIQQLVKAIEKADILYIPDCVGEPAFSNAVFAMPEVRAALESLRQRGGLVYGEGNGIEVLISSGMLELDTTKIGICKNPGEKMICSLGKVKCVSVLSPMIRRCSAGELYDTLTVGKRLRLCGDPDYIRSLAFEGRIAAQYTSDSNVLMCTDGIEAISSHDGCVLGRLSRPLRLSTPENYRVMPVVTSAVSYFKTKVSNAE